MGTAILLELVRTFSSMVSNGKVRAWGWAGQGCRVQLQGWGREAVGSKEQREVTGTWAPHLAPQQPSMWP